MVLFNKKEIVSSAEVVDKHLILSLPNAVEPIVWRMQLDKIGTASFEIKKAKKDGIYNLVLKAKKGTAETIAPFSDKEQALNALIHASEALQKPEVTNNNIVSNNDNNNPAPKHGNNSKKGSNKWLYLFLGFLAVIGLYIFMTKQLPNKINDFGGSPQSLSSSPNPQSQTGVPLSADDFLNGL